MVAVASDEGLCELTLDRPDKRNALTNEFWADLEHVLDDANADASVRVLIVRGAGNCFSAGGDIAGFADLDDVPVRREYQRRALQAFRAFETFPKPTIAAVHGYALGGGCELTMVADLVIADGSAVFGTPEVTVGLMPGLGVVRGAANTNLHWLKYMVFTGEQLDAEEARLAGLVTHVVAEGAHIDEARRLARRIAEMPAVALQVAKRILNRGSAEGYEYSLEATALLHGTFDQAEGVSAFRDRRPPRFQDR